MKKLLSILLLTLPLHIHADTITGMVQSVGFSATPSQRIVFTPLDTPKNVGGVFIRSAPVEVYATTSGWFSNQLVGGVCYRVSVGNTAQYTRDVMTNCTVGDGGTYNWLSITTNASLANTATLAFVTQPQLTTTSNALALAGIRARGSVELSSGSAGVLHPAITASSIILLTFGNDNDVNFSRLAAINVTSGSFDISCRDPLGAQGGNGIVFWAVLNP